MLLNMKSVPDTNDIALAKDDLPQVAFPGLLKRIRTVQKGALKRPQGRPTAEQADHLRDTMIHTALHEFMTRGFEGASLEAIAREAKVGKVTIYRQFGTKEALFREVLGFARHSLREQLTASIVEGTPRQVLRNVIGRLVEVVSHPDFVAVLRLTIAEAPRFPDLAAAASKNSDFALTGLVEYLDRLRADGVIFIEDPHVAASQLAELATGGVRTLVRPRPTRAERKRTVDAVYTTLARAWGLEQLPAPVKSAQADQSR
ncbi:TetR/AcrR family transcriptional regulator [Burkholderia seminalis]|uniref:TetR/AcrR family transcriptional regulator n=1 Tax=Burkholderia seminalis TaxID=488731 RepID=UPI00158A7FC8|nr:TetR/AcrR family transcriptional regulator [Burkholderia seminalis]